MMELSKRLKAVADMVSPGKRLADVGTDHGYIPIYLTERGIIPSAIAMDINRGPLMRAEEHIREYGLTDKIQTRLSDGLKNLKSEEADTMIAAGMGGGLVIRILSDSSQTAEELDEVILQPQSEIRKVREYLCGHGYRIVEENMVLEDGKYYPMMKAVRGDAGEYSPEELEFGKLLLEQKHPVLKEYLEREIRIGAGIRESLKNQNSGRARARIEEVVHRIDMIEALLAKYYTEEKK